MMDSRFFVIVLLLVAAISVEMIGSDAAYAHKANIVGDYKLDVGWKVEPPVANEPNAIEVVLSIASDFDKQRYDAVYYASDAPADESAITGLADDLEVYVKVGGGKKTLLDLTEDPDISGTYYGEYVPQEPGLTKIDIYGTISGADFEATFHPEKVKENTKVNAVISIPDWIRNNAKWWSEGTIGDSDFTSGIQYLIKNHILNVPITQQQESTSNEIPEWIKNNAGWWADSLISDDDFVKGIQYMITNGIIVV